MLSQFFVIELSLFILFGLVSARFDPPLLPQLLVLQLSPRIRIRLILLFASEDGELIIGNYVTAE